MSDVKYLYGAAVQGIQGFIFQTNRLREIVGASELVEEICTSKFAQILGHKGYYPELKKLLVDDLNCILHAAGNIKYIFEKDSDCKKVVRALPKAISELAPGITVSQAVVVFDDVQWNENLPTYIEKDGKNVFQSFGNAVDELESRLRTQRNKPMRSATLGLMAVERSRQTGLPIIYKNEQEERLDAGTFAKLQYEWETKDGRNGSRQTAKRKTTRNLCVKAFNDPHISNNQIAFDTEKMTSDNDWIAIIHADGNGLGQVVQRVGKDRSMFKEFSEKLDNATTISAQKAFGRIKDTYSLKEDGFIPIRPIVLGGDDFTFLCRADLALDYVTAFIDEFELNTREHLGDILKNFNVFENETDKRLTACAGIAYIKSSFPFYYGYNLAETLCSRAKKDAKDKQEIKEGKELPKSCLMFHKVQDSFTEEWEAIAKRELTPQQNISFEFGPYYISDANGDKWTVEALKRNVAMLESKNTDGNAVKSHLRQWMSLLHDNPQMANQKLQRLKSMTSNTDLLNLIKNVTFEYKTDDKNQKSSVYDILTIHTINNQVTKED